MFFLQDVVLEMIQQSRNADTIFTKKIMHLISSSCLTKIRKHVQS